MREETDTGLLLLCEVALGDSKEEIKPGCIRFGLVPLVDTRHTCQTRSVIMYVFFSRMHAEFNYVDLYRRAPHMYHSLVGRGKSSYDPAALRDVKLSASDVALKAVAGLPQVMGARSIVTGLCEGRESPCALVSSLFLCLSVDLCRTCSLSNALSLPHTLYLSLALSF
jgi:hypothetical protein